MAIRNIAQRKAEAEGSDLARERLAQEPDVEARRRMADYEISDEGKERGRDGVGPSEAFHLGFEHTLRRYLEEVGS